MAIKRGEKLFGFFFQIIFCGLVGKITRILKMGFDVGF